MFRWQMSRAPQHDAYSSSLTNALTPFGVIDFVDNHCLQAQASAASLSAATGVVGGPPAYLEAHGIRYVPQAILESPGGGAETHTPASTASEPRAPTRYDIESRVDDRVRKFMRERADSDSGLGETYRVRGAGLHQSASDDYDLERVLGRRGLDSDADLDPGEIRKLRMEVEAAAKAQSVRAGRHVAGESRGGPRRGKGKAGPSVDF